MVRFVVGWGLAVASLLGAYLLEGGDPWGLLMISAFLITVLVPVFSVLAVWSARQFGLAWRAAFRPVEKADAAEAVRLWAFVETAAYLAGLLAFLAGGVLVGNNVEGADAVRFGHVIAALLVAPIYGVLEGLTARILRARVESLAGA